MSNKRLIAFYCGEGHIIRGVDSKTPSFWLEHTHDYIQWLFPISEMGRFSAFAPLLTSEVQSAFGREASLRQRQQRSLDVMLEFFGLEREKYVITAQPNLSIQTHI